MFVGSLGTPTLVVTVLVGVIAPGPGSTTQRVLVTISGLFLVAMAVLNRPVTAWVVRVGQRYASRRLVPALSEQRVELLVLSERFAVQSVTLRAPVESIRSLRGLTQALPGATVLGVRRPNGEYIGEPPSDIDLDHGDELILYGRRDAVAP